MRFEPINLMLFAIICLFLPSCCEPVVRENSSISKPVNQTESLIKVNRYLIIQEKKDIKNYINRHNWIMKETGSGLLYSVYHEGDGVQAETGKTAVINFKTRLLSGEVVYSSDSTGPKTFKIGHGGVESGLEEGILYLKEGDKAYLILPSHLAYGLLGDNKMIPPRAPIIYQIELIEVK